MRGICECELSVYSMCGICVCFRVCLGFVYGMVYACTSMGVFE